MNDYSGRSDHNAMVVFPVGENYKPGQYVDVLIERSTTATLISSIDVPALFHQT